MNYTVGTPDYNNQVQKIDTSTPAYGPTFDAIHQQLLNNDSYLSNYVALMAILGLEQSHLNSVEIDKYKNQRILQGQATLTNADQSPYFRASDPFVSVALPGYQQINSPNYAVVLDVISADDIGRVGELTVYGKTQNGFNVKMTGSAKTVTFLWTLINPNV